MHAVLSLSEVFESRCDFIFVDLDSNLRVSHLHVFFFFFFTLFLRRETEFTGGCFN